MLVSLVALVVTCLLLQNVFFSRNVSKDLKDIDNITDDACSNIHSKKFRDFSIASFRERRDQICNDYGVNIGKIFVIES